MILSTHGLIASQISQFTGLLDLYRNAAAAYSLRRLRGGYTGSAIRVRRTNLDEMDIGFTSTGALDTAALLAFTGTGVLDNGFITTWYDQSGNGYNATQTTALNQPQIVSSGSVLTENGKPAVQFNGSTQGLVNTTSDVIATNSANSFLFVGRNITVVDFQNIIWAKNAIRIVTAVGLGYPDFSIFNTSAPIAPYTFNKIPNLNQYLLSIYWDGISATNSNYNTYGNNTLLTPGPSIQGAVPNSFSLGFRNDNNSQYWNGNMQEIIIYPSNKLSDNSGINTNINSFYSIY
jgi:hypothetical protein